MVTRQKKNKLYTNSFSSPPTTILLLTLNKLFSNIAREVFGRSSYMYIQLNLRNLNCLSRDLKHSSKTGRCLGSNKETFAIITNLYYLYKYSKVKIEKSQKLLGEVFTLFSLYCDPCSGRASSFKIPRCSKFLEGAHLVINLFLLYCQYNGCTLKFYLLLEMISKLHITVFVMFLIQLPVSFSAAKNLKKNYISALPTLPFLAARLETPFFFASLFIFHLML